MRLKENLKKRQENCLIKICLKIFDFVIHPITLTGTKIQHNLYMQKTADRFYTEKRQQMRVEHN